MSDAEGLDGIEVVFRSIRVDDVVLLLDTSEWQLSSSAFNDRKMKPSVDRAAIEPDPYIARQSDDDGVVSLQTRDVQTKVDLVINPNDKPPKVKQFYAVSIFARPIPPNDPEGRKENPAHAQIETAPDFANPSHFKKLREKLCRLARMVILPPAVKLSE